MPSKSFIERNPHLYGNRRALPDENLKLLRQSAQPKLNKLERAFQLKLICEVPPPSIIEQAIGLKLANGCVYWADFAVFHGGKIIFYEVKGFMRDDAAVKIKVAATTFPQFNFVLVWRAKGQWKQQTILP